MQRVRFYFSIFLFSLIIFPGNVFAKEKNSYYIGAYGGWLKYQSTRMEYYDYQDPAIVGQRFYEFGAGYRLGAFAGKRINRYFRVELEYSYMRGKEEYMIDSFEGEVDIENPHQVGRQISHAALLNAYLDLDFPALRKFTNFIPYVGIGFGGMHIDYKGRDSEHLYTGIFALRSDEWKIAGQLAGGVNYDLPAIEKAGIEYGDLTLGINYKYLRMISEKLETVPVNPREVESDQYKLKRKPVASHFVGLSLAYNF